MASTLADGVAALRDAGAPERVTPAGGRELSTRWVATW